MHEEGRTDGAGEHSAPPVGVVVMAYGTPASPDDVEAYYTHIRRGSPPTPEQLAELTMRYEAIGGISPLAERTEAQRAALEAALDQRAPGRCRVVLGQKHAAPFIEDAVAELADDGVEAIVGLVLAPHFSRFSVGQYQERLATAAAERGVTAAGIESWHLEPTFLSFLRRSARALALPERTKVLFTAHSLPERVLVDDPYPDQLRASAGASPRRPASTAGPGGRCAGSRPVARPSPGVGPTSSRCCATSPPPGGPTACSCARRGS